jgi:antitoxin HigA-1
MAIQIASLFAVHPGVWLKEEVVEPHGIGVTQLATHFGVSRQAMSTLLNGRVGLSADMAIRFEKAFGLNAQTLCVMQTNFDLAQARASSNEILVGPILAAA